MNDDTTEHDSTELPPAATTHRMGRRKRAGIVTAGVAGIALTCGGIAWASTAASATPASSSGYGYGGPGGYGGAGHGAGSHPTGTRPSGTAPTAAVRTPHLAGTVKSVSGTTILITDGDGFTRTVKVSSATTYQDSLTASPAVGTKIEAQGTVDADGTSLDATVIESPKMPSGGPGNGGGRPAQPKPTSTTTS
jgi:hypothetical protein